MPKLPTVTAREAIAAFERLGFEIARSKGSHYTLKKPGHQYVLTVPMHGSRPLTPGVLRRLIKDAGITVAEFLKARH